MHQCKNLEPFLLLAVAEASEHYILVFISNEKINPVDNSERNKIWFGLIKYLVFSTHEVCSQDRKFKIGCMKITYIAQADACARQGRFENYHLQLP